MACSRSKTFYRSSRQLTNFFLEMSLLGWPGIRRIFCRRNLLLNMVTMLSSTTKGFLISILISQVQFGMSDTYWLQKICKHTVKHLQKICTTPCPINQMWNASRWKIFLGQAVKMLCNSWKSTQFCVSWYNQFLFWLLRIKRKVCSAINFCTLTRGEPFSSFWGERYMSHRLIWLQIFPHLQNQY